MPLRHHADVEQDAAQLLLRLEGRVSELAELLNGMSVNHVLFCGTILIGTAGYTEMTFRVPFGAVSVANLAGATITVHNSAAGDPANPPKSGRGVVVCATAGDGTWTISGNILTVYGPANGQVVLEVMATAQTPDL